MSGGARGVDTAAMQGATEAGGVSIGVLANDLRKTSVNRQNRIGLQEGRLALISPFYPEAGFNAGNAMARHKYIYTLADQALVIDSALGSGGTWEGALEDLQQRWVPLYVRTPGNGAGNAALDRYSALEAVAPRVDAMQREEFQDTLRGVGTALCYFVGARNEYLKPLYEVPEPGRVREEGDFRLLLPRILRGLSSGRMSKLNEGQLDYLCALVYQLFLNADQHGAYDVSGARYSPGVRGITARLTVLDDIASLIRYAGDDRALRIYLARLGARRTLDPADGAGNRGCATPL